MKFAIACIIFASVAFHSLSAPVVPTSLDESMLQSISEALLAQKTSATIPAVAAAPIEPSESESSGNDAAVAADADLAVENAQVAESSSDSPKFSGKGTRFVRLQSARAHFQVSYVSVQIADGTVVSQGKSVSSSCGACGYPAAPNAIVNGAAEARAHPGSWHSSPGHDWIEIDLGQEFHVTKVVFYNRADCCQERAAQAVLTLLDSTRGTIDSALLNGNMMQIFDFKSCSIDQNTASYKNNHADHVSPMLSLLCGLQQKIRGTQINGQKQVAAAMTVAEQKKAIADKAQQDTLTALAAANALSNQEKIVDIQNTRELEMIDKIVSMIHSLNGKGLGNSPASPVVDIAELGGRPSGFYFVKPNGETNAVKVYVDNERNGGGWVLVARVTRASCQAHMNRAAVNLKSALEGPTKDATDTIKFDDRFIQNLRTSSSAKGNIGYWMEADQFRKDVFISSQATVDLEGSAINMPQRTNVVNSYGTSAALSQRHPNTGTRGFGDHHTSGGTFFAWGRHPESCPTCNCGFREDSLGSSDGYLWVR